MTAKDTVKIQDFILWAHENGCAVAVWFPEELAGTRARDMEDHMISAGWDWLSWNGVEPMDGEDRK